jgi:hypothetical protein
VGNTITDSILGAWDEEEQAPAQESEGAEPDATTPAAEVQDEAPSDDIEETPATEEEEVSEEEVSEEPGEEVEEEEPSEEEEPEEVSEEETPSAEFTSDDPDVLAYLARHGNDPEAALKAAASQEKILGRQGRELGQLRARVEELEAEAEQAALFSTGRVLSAEQQAWVEEAVGSENALPYIQLAIQEGEFDLARAVLEQGEFSTAQVVRLSQGIDAAEGRSMQQEIPVGQIDHQRLFAILQEHYPDMPQYEAEMTATLASLGDDHPVSIAAHSHDPGEAAQGIISLYEIARAKKTTVASAREEVKTKNRQAADDVRRQAQVMSAQATRNQAQAPRSKQLMPGLTLDALEAEFNTE